MSYNQESKIINYFEDKQIKVDCIEEYKGLIVVRFNLMTNRSFGKIKKVCEEMLGYEVFKSADGMFAETII